MSSVEDRGSPRLTAIPWLLFWGSPLPELSHTLGWTEYKLFLGCKKVECAMQLVSAWHEKHTDTCLGTVTPFVDGESTPETGQQQEAVNGLNHLAVPEYTAKHVFGHNSPFSRGHF